LDKKVIAFIPVRGGSKSIPGKNSKLLAGKPLLFYVLEAALQAKNVTEVIVSTDDDKIKDILRHHFQNEPKLEVFNRSDKNATDTASTESTILEYLDANQKQLDSVFILLQATSPLTTTADIENAIDLYKSSTYGGLISVVNQKRFIWENNAPINYNPQNRPRRQDYNGYLVENGAIYISTIVKILESKCRVSPPYINYEMPEDTFVEIDEPSDWDILEKIIKKRRNKSLIDFLPSKVEALVLDFDGVFTENKVTVFEDGTEAVVCDRGDGMGIEMLKKKSLPIWVISKEKNAVLTARCNKLGIPCTYGIENKLELLKYQLTEKGISPKNVVYVGNDLNDIACMQFVGCGVAVADAYPQVKEIAKIVLNKNGGNGAIRELCELILKNI
jgi:YrbI family 3-deoxy-D-manno-octulosonate 8-phosphate phosphatase